MEARFATPSHPERSRIQPGLYSGYLLWTMISLAALSTLIPFPSRAVAARFTRDSSGVVPNRAAVSGSMVGRSSAITVLSFQHLW